MAVLWFRHVSACADPEDQVRSKCPVLETHHRPVWQEERWKLNVLLQSRVMNKSVVKLHAEPPPPHDNHGFRPRSINPPADYSRSRWSTESRTRFSASRSHQMSSSSVFVRGRGLLETERKVWLNSTISWNDPNMCFRLWNNRR